jgi:hypothetical protein
MGGALVGKVAEIVDDAIDHEPRAQQMEEVKRPQNRGIGLEELPDEPLRAVPHAEDIEAAPHGPGRADAEAADIDRQE